MKSNIDINTWYRKEHFEFFNSMNDPFTGVVANVDCTRAHKDAKEMGTSFWLYYLHKSLLAANEVEEFRYRIENNDVVCYDKVHAGSTLDNVDKTFAFAFLNYRESYADFVQEALPLIETIRSKPGMGFNDDHKRNDCIHYTTLPWISFTSLKHACQTGSRGSCPKISFGKYFPDNGKLLLPVSVEVNHALMDGRQIGSYFELFQELLNH